MRNPENILDDLQADVAARLRGDEYFSDIPVVTDRLNDIEAEVQKSLGVLTGKDGKIGVCTIVMQLVANDAGHQSERGPMDVLVSVRVIENVLMNKSATGTGKSALSVSRRVFRVLKLAQFIGMATPLYPQKPALVPSMVPIAEDVMGVSYEVRFGARESQAGTPGKVAVPIFTVLAGSCSLACSTSGATIHYTADGTCPVPGETGTTEYTAPFAVNSGDVIRAGAWKSGSIASDVNMEIVT